MLVKDILRHKGSNVYSISPDDTVFNAISKMADLNIGALVVLDGTRLAGIISERDYRNKVILKGRTSKTTAIKEIMVDKVYTVTPKNNINTCMQIMTNKKIRHLPVVENEQVIGMISIGDVVKEIIDKQKVEIDSLRGYISGGYPG